MWSVTCCNCVLSITIVKLLHTNSLIYGGFAQDIPTFSISFQSSSPHEPHKGYDTVINKDVQSFLESTLIKDFEENGNEYLFSELILNSNVIDESSNLVTMTFDGTLHFDSNLIPEYYEVKRFVLSTFTTDNSKQQLISMIKISTDDFFKNVHDFSFSFGEVMNEIPNVDPQEESPSHLEAVNKWFVQTDEWVTIVAGCSVGVLGALFVAFSFIFVRGSTPAQSNQEKEIEQADKLESGIMKLSIQQSNSITASNSTSSTNNDSPSSTPEKTTTIKKGAKGDCISEFQYSLHSFNSCEDLSKFTYEHICTPIAGDSVLVREKFNQVDDVIMRAQHPKIDESYHLPLANMEVNIASDYESPRSQVTQNTLFNQENLFSPASPKAAHAKRLPPSPKTTINTAIPSTSPTLPSVEPTPLKSNLSFQQNVDESNENKATADTTANTDTLLYSFSVNSVIEEESKEESHSQKSVSITSSTNSRELLQKVLGFNQEDQMTI